MLPPAFSEMNLRSAVIRILTAPTPERIEGARQELESLGIGGFDSESLLAMYDDPVFAEFEKANAELEKTLEAFAEPLSDASERAWEDYERACENVRDLAIAAGSIAAKPAVASRRTRTISPPGADGVL